MDEISLSRLALIAPNFGSPDPGIRATAAQAAHRIVTDAGDCWQDLLRQRPSPLLAKPVHWRVALRVAIDSDTPSNEFEQRFLDTLLHWNGAPTPERQATLENVVSRLVRTPPKIRF
jgi:hypothetical protein